MINALALILMLAAPDTSGCATINVRSFVPQPFASGSYPTHALSMETPRPSEPPVSGYQRVRVTWAPQVVDSVSYVRHRSPEYITHPLFTLPGGTATFDEPINPGRVDLLFLGTERATSQWMCDACMGVGTVKRPDPKDPKKLVTLRCDACAGLGKLGGSRSMWSCYRGVPDWTSYIGTDAFAPGQERTMRIYPASGETVSIARTWRR
jgi:hypothetical protein